MESVSWFQALKQCSKFTHILHGMIGEAMEADCGVDDMFLIRAEKKAHFEQFLDTFQEECMFPCLQQEVDAHLWDPIRAEMVRLGSVIEEEKQEKSLSEICVAHRDTINLFFVQNNKFLERVVQMLKQNH